MIQNSNSIEASSSSNSSKKSFRRQNRQERLLKAKLESLELFVRVIAHDLNGPLTSINLTLQALRRISCSAEVEKLIQVIDRDVLQATSLLEDLKTLNKREVYRLQKINITHEIRQVVERIDLIKNSNIDIHWSTEPHDLYILGDSIRLRRVWHNVITNALDAIALKKRDEKIRVYVSLKKRNHFVRVQFRDAAGGIAKEYLPRLFEPFYTTKGTKYRGLGLFIARKIIDEHNGKMRLVSRRPYTRVTIDIPVAP
ncbi:MAG TPA: HAMP domain-containing sensor histidine kinase [Turneriella sp.]|nr:HAMP domain-containing sensor histidine kinase [Turneriella sp.]